MPKKLILAVAILFISVTCFGGNDTASNPKRIDTFAADVELSPGVLTVTSIVMEGATAGDTATFIDASGAEVLRLSNTANSGSVIWTPATPFRFSTGISFDTSASSLGTNDYIFIYCK